MILIEQDPSLHPECDWACFGRDWALVLAAIGLALLHRPGNPG